MKIESFIARRYLLSKHKINFISIISFISIAGITIGVAALIVVLSVFNGFGGLVKSYLISFDPHLRIEIVSLEKQKEYQHINDELKKITSVERFSPYVSGKVLAIIEKEMAVVNLKGINILEGEDIYGIKPNLMFGSYFNREGTDLPQIVLGLPLADRLQSLVGDTITIISPSGIEQAIISFSLPQMQKFVVAGIYSSNNNEYDANYVFTPLANAQKLLGYSGRIQGFDIRLIDINKSDKVKEILSVKLNPSEYRTYTWFDFHKELYSFMKIERWIAYFLLCLIIAVATFNILGSLSMFVVEKKRDIGILRSLGITENSILRIFMFEGLLIGLIGTVAGSALGYVICYIHLKYNIYPLDPTQYKINSLPLDIQFADFLFITGASMLLSFFASYYPAKRAAKVNPIEAIKWE
jgi:lipoprotein-releasing system permease protein